MTRWHTEDWRAIKRAAARVERDLAVQGWLVVFIALGALLASLAA